MFGGGRRSGGRTLVKGWLSRSMEFWIHHGFAAIAVLILVIFVGGPVLVIGVATLAPGRGDEDSQSMLSVESPAEGRIIGFIGGPRAGPLKAFFRTSRNEYGFALMPQYSGCHDGDRILLTETRTGNHISFVARHPLCRRAEGRVGTGRNSG